MARIRIDDLPAAQDLTPEEQEQLLGAGRPGFRPGFEALEGREMYAANITAGVTAGVLHVRTLHQAGTEKNDAISFRLVNKQLQLFNEANKVVKTFDTAETARIKAIDVVMEGRGDHLNVDFTGLGKLPGSARQMNLGEGQSADVTYTNQRGEKVQAHSREYDNGTTHIKETNLTIGVRQFKVMERSNPCGAHGTDHFITVEGDEGMWVTGDDHNQNGFLVKSQIPGQAGSMVLTKFDSYGGMWDGQGWAPQEGQKLLESGGKAINAGWKDGRWVVTTGSGGTTQVSSYESFGRAGEGAKVLERTTTTATGLKIHGTLQTNGTWSETTTGSSDFQTRTEVYDKADGDRQLQSRTTKYADRTVSGVWQDFEGTRRWVETTTGPTDFRSRTEVYDKPGGQKLRIITLKNDGSREVFTPTGVSNDFMNRTEVYDKTGKLVSRYTDYLDRAIQGQWQGDKWVEKWVTTSTHQYKFRERTDVYDKPDGNLLTRDTIYGNQKVHGQWQQVENQRRWVETTTGSSDFQKRTEVKEGVDGKLLSQETIKNDGSRVLTTFNRDGYLERTEVYSKENKLVSRDTTTYDNRLIHGEWEQVQGARRWVERTKFSTEYQLRTEAFDRPDGNLLTRDTTYGDRTVHGEWKQVLGVRRWVERTTNSSQFKSRTEVKVGVDGKLLRQDTRENNGTFTFGELKVDGRWVVTTYTNQFVTRAVHEGGGYIVSTADGYQILNGEGRIVAYHRQTKDGRWIEENWVARWLKGNQVVDNLYTYKEYSMKGGQRDQLLVEVSITNGIMTYTKYHVPNVSYWWHGYCYDGTNGTSPAKEATLTWTYKMNADGTLGQLQKYEIKTDRDYTNTWTQGHGWDLHEWTGFLWPQVSDWKFPVPQVTLEGLDLRGITALPEGLGDSIGQTLLPPGGLRPPFDP